MTRAVSVDTPGFTHYIGGGRRYPYPPPTGQPTRAMFEFRRHDEDCLPGCGTCKPPDPPPRA